MGYSIFLALFSLSGFPDAMQTANNMPFLADKPVGEDGFYLLLVAWNLALAKGFVANFGAVVTGVQPLVVFVYSIVALIGQSLGGDKFDFVRAIIVFGAVNSLVFAHLVGKLCAVSMHSEEDRLGVYCLSFSLILSSFYVFRTFTYGLETGLYLTLIAGTMLYGASRSSPCGSLAESVTFGILLGITGLCRIDFGLVAFGLLALTLIRGRSRPVHVVLAGLVALSLTAPWFVWVHAVSGHWVPSSGPAQAMMVNADTFWIRLAAMLAAVQQNAFPWLFTGGSRIAAFLGIAALCAIVGGMLLLKRDRFNEVVTENARRNLAEWTCCLVTLVPVYFLFFWATHFYPRYTAPLMIPAIVATVAMLKACFTRPFTNPLLTSIIFGAFACNAALAVTSLHRGAIGNNHAVVAGYVSTQLKDREKVGAFQSGVIGYFNENVINLDGKVNFSALEARKRGDLVRYIDSEGISSIVDWKDIVDEVVSKFEPGRWRECEKRINNGASICVERAGRN
jgi:hypothetical protein